MQDQANGLCRCGCGEPTTIAAYTSTRDGMVKGQPLRWKKGHHFRKPKPAPEFCACGCGQFAKPGNAFINGHNVRQPRTWTVVPSGCWEWDGTLSVEGYGVFRENYVQVKAHRWVYEQHVGPIPEGLTIDHLCRNRRCVNPAHLEPVTAAENARRAKAHQFNT